MSEVARNLGFINSVVCPLTKAALLECTDPDTIERLKLAYPEAFPAKACAIKYGWKQIRNLWKRRTRSQQPSSLYLEDDTWFHVTWLEIFTEKERRGWTLEFGFEMAGDPIAWNGGPTIPPEIVLQLWKLETLETPIIIQYKGASWIVGYFRGCFSCRLEHIRSIATEEDGAGAAFIQFALMMVPLASIDMTK